MCARTPPPPPPAQPPTPAHPPGPPPRAPVGAGRVAGRSLIVHLTVDRTGRIGAPVSRRQGVQMVSTAGQLARSLNKNQAEGGRFELPRACALAVFKTAALDHSATPP